MSSAAIVIGALRVQFEISRKCEIARSLCITLRSEKIFFSFVIQTKNCWYVLKFIKLTKSLIRTCVFAYEKPGYRCRVYNANLLSLFQSKGSSGVF